MSSLSLNPATWRYRPAPYLILLVALVLGMLAFHALALQPARLTLQHQYHQLVQQQQKIQEQMQQKPSAEAQQLLAQLHWQSGDASWQQTIINTMNQAQQQTANLQATYALATPLTVTWQDDTYLTQRIDLDIKTNDDRALWRFIHTLQQTMPGRTVISQLQVSHNAPMQPGQVQITQQQLSATLTLTLYRLVAP